MADHFGDCAHHVLFTVGTRVFGNLAQAGGTKLHITSFANALNADVRASDDDRAALQESSVAVYVAYYNLWCREHKPLRVAQVVPTLYLGGDVDLYLLHLGLALAYLCKVFLYAAFECRELFLPFLEYSVHISCALI